MKPIEINEKPIMPTDYEEKYNFIVAKLEETVFDGIAPDDCWDISYDKMGNEIRKKRATKKNELKPVLTPSMVDFKLQSLLRLTMPMDDEKVKSLEPQDYLTAFHWYFELMYFCSSYITLSPNKQGFCAFAGITVAQYNDLLGDSYFCTAFNSIEDGLLQNSFVAGESGLVDTKTLNTKLSAVGQGHSLRKPDNETTFYIQQNKIDKAVISAKLDEFTKMIEGK